MRAAGRVAGRAFVAPLRLTYIVHGLQGWYPLVPLLRRLGLRTQNEIEQERNALRMLRGDHEPFQSATFH